MPQKKEPLIRRLVRQLLKEDITVGPENTKFSLKLIPSNPQSETKQGLRIQLMPKEGYLDPELKKELSSAVMTRINDSLKKFDLQISVDSDTSDPDAMGFYIPMEQLTNMIKVALGGSKGGDEDNNTPPNRPPIPPRPSPAEKPTPEPINEMRVRDLKEISGVILKEDFYQFINAGNNVLRTLEENGMTHINGKKYLEYLVKHNIM